MLSDKMKSLVLVLLLKVGAALARKCEMLEPLSDEQRFELFRFYQHDERLDPNTFVKVVFKIISSYRPEDVVKKVTLDYNPNLKSEVGRYPILSTVTIMQDGLMKERCYEIVIDIQDTDECTLSYGHAWAHKCDASTVCVNTVGSYYCACHEGEFVVPESGLPGSKTEITSKFCDNDACRSDFKCHSNSCAFSSCPDNSFCEAGQGPNSYSCVCLQGFRDVGGQLTPHCVAHNRCAHHKCPKGCSCDSATNKTVDGYFCNPKPGHMTYVPGADEWEIRTIDPFRLDDHLCINQDRPPQLMIEGSNPMYIKEGETYKEMGVKIVDDNTGDLKRRFTTDYAEASVLAESRCGVGMVRYSIETPWIRGRPSVTAERKVEVIDLDECAAGLHNCSRGARCVNVECAGFVCSCPADGYAPDGRGGCADRRPPVIECEVSGCEKARLLAMKGAGAILEDPTHPTGLGAGAAGVIHLESDVTSAWLEAVLEKVQPRSPSSHACN